MESQQSQSQKSLFTDQTTRRKLLNIIFCVILFLSLFMKRADLQFLAFFICILFLVIKISILLSEKQGWKSIISSFSSLLPILPTLPTIVNDWLKGLVDNLLSLVDNLINTVGSISFIQSILGENSHEKISSFVQTYLEENTREKISTFLLILLTMILYNIFETIILKRSDEYKTYEKLCDELDKKVKVLCRELDMFRMGNEAENKLFTPVQAEVELRKQDVPKRCEMNLVQFLKRKNTKNKIYLVLGEPGSGKSVSLRELFQQLMKKRKHRKCAPAYINLNKWSINEKTINEKNLLDYIHEELFYPGNKNPSHDEQDKARQFDGLVEKNRWYFIFDSFDEIPSFVGGKCEQKYINKVFQVLFTFLENHGGGVIASRFYHSPSSGAARRFTEKGFHTVTLRLQSFTERSIKKMLKRYLKNSWETVWDDMTKDRPELLDICQTPFYLAMLIYCMEKNVDKKVSNQNELIERYVDYRIKEGIQASDITENEMIIKELVTKICNAAQWLAKTIHQSPQNECSKADFIQYNKTVSNYDWVKILTESRMCRVVGKDIVFSHRRFQEYFFSKELSDQDWDNICESILHDNGIRDTLVLYCEASTEEDWKNENSLVRKIFSFCLSVITEGKFQEESIYSDLNSCRRSILDSGSMKLVNTLYFFSEAFRNNKDKINTYLQDWQKKCDDECFERIFPDNFEKCRETDLEMMEAAAHAMRVFDQPIMEKYAPRVFEIKNRWLNNIMIRNFRSVTKLEPDAKLCVCEYLRYREIFSFIKQFRITNAMLFPTKCLWIALFFHILRFCRLLSYVLFLVLLFVNLFITINWENLGINDPWLMYGLYAVPWFLNALFIVEYSAYRNKHPDYNGKHVKLIAKHFLNIVLIPFVLIILPYRYAIFFIFPNPSIAIVYSFAFCIPILFEMPWMIYKFIKIIKSKKSQIFESPVFYLFMYAIIIFIIFAIKLSAENLFNISKYIFWGLYLAIFVYMLYLAFKVLLKTIHDGRVFKKNKDFASRKTENKDRDEFKEILNQLKTNFYRKKYVRLFLNNCLPLNGCWKKNGNPAQTEDLVRPLFYDDILDHDLKELDVQNPIKPPSTSQNS